MVNLRTTIRKNTSVTLLPLTDLAQSGARGTDFARSGYCARGRKHDTEPTDCPTIRRAERARHQSAAPWRLIVECSPARSRPCACAAACAWRRWNVLRRRKDHIDTSASRRTLSLPRFRGHPNERECSQHNLHSAGKRHSRHKSIDSAEPFNFKKHNRNQPRCGSRY